MSINKTRCRKCNGSAFFMKQHNNNTGLYCGDCGAWQKWLNKDEINAWKHYFEQVDEMRISKEEKEIDQMVQKYIDKHSKSTGIELYENSLPLERFSRLVEWIDNEIKREKEYQSMISHLDRIRSLSYCFALQQIKRGIENILNGREFNDDGDEM